MSFSLACPVEKAPFKLGSKEKVYRLPFLCSVFFSSFGVLRDLKVKIRSSVLTCLAFIQTKCKTQVKVSIILKQIKGTTKLCCLKAIMVKWLNVEHTCKQTPGQEFSQ